MEISYNKLEPLTLEMLMKICEALGVNVGDVVEFIKKV